MTQLSFDGLSAGRAARDSALSAFEGRPFAGEWIREARQVAAAICRRKGWVIADDIWQECPLPEGLHENTKGAVLRAPMFTPIGFTQSRHETGHARAIRIWRLA